ncbi:putative aminopeptidase y protein [Botrytis fragariae]|uniref:Peptide hydrolase n=1 Tax=Botrytis fragariae TaxID=1964551 RepID=A0A8H6ANJ0_9HELO|nr:putative aminopeptidase y protein [Botrytis fragariae]KAF5870732.1 putative aminopeptidase y protein [Botrytis fragariae]
MLRSTLFLAAASLVTGAVIQQPIAEPSSQSLINEKHKPLIKSTSLQNDIKTKNLLKRANQLYKIAEESIPEYNHPTRVIGSKGHESTVDYIYSSIASLGDYYDISNQSFPAVVGNIFDYRLVLGDAVPKTATPMSLTPPTANKDAVFGPLVLVSNNGCDATDYPAEVAGSIALILRGTCSFGDKSANAGKAGAIAAVVYNNANGSLSGTLGAPNADHIATFGISDEEAAPYVEKLKNGESIDGSAFVDALVEEITTTNIIAQTKGGDANNCVMLGGHSDSVEAGPGINDDGTGTISLLEVATQLTNYKVNNCVRFGWWAGEEEGLLGSDYYVSQLSDEENLKIRLFMDYDMMASPNYAYQVYNATDAANPDGSEALRNLYTKWYKSHQLNYTYIPFDGRSDYDAFIKNGIPGGGIATGAEGVKTAVEVEMFGGKAGDWYDPCYHQLCDDLSNLALDAWLINTQLIAHSVATYAASFEGFPKRTLESVSAAAAKKVKEETKYHGPQLVM